MSPRILYITGEYPPMVGGIGDYTAQLRLALAGQGFLTTVASDNSAHGDGVNRLPGFGPRGIWRLRRLLGRGAIDIVHLQYQAGMYRPTLLMPWIKALAGLRVPLVTTFHDLRAPYLFSKAGRLRPAAVRALARSSAAVIVTNPSDARTLERWNLSPTLIPIGPNLPPPVPGQVVDPTRVAYFGLPTRGKGLPELIAAVAANPSMHLRCVGADGDPSRSADILSADAIQQLGATHGVTIARSGYLTPQQASNELASAGVIGLPFRAGASWRSGSLLAALQSGRPVVTTRSDELGDLACLRQVTLVAPGDAPGLAEALALAAAGPVEADALPTRFRWQSIAREHLALYERLTGES